MIRLILHLFLFLFLSSYSCEAYRFSSSDQKVLNSFWKYAEEHRLGNLPVNERIPSIARFFLGTPYQSNTLNVTREELPVINLHELDCVTFVENVLALAFWNNIINNRQRLSCKILSGSDTGMQRSSTILPVYTILQIGYMKCNKLIC